MPDLSATKLLVMQFFTKEIAEYAIADIHLGSQGTIIVTLVHPLTTQLQSVNGIPIEYHLRSTKEPTDES